MSSLDKARIEDLVRKADLPTPDLRWSYLQKHSGPEPVDIGTDSQVGRSQFVA